MVDLLKDEEHQLSYFTRLWDLSAKIYIDNNFHFGIISALANEHVLGQVRSVPDV